MKLLDEIKEFFKVDEKLDQEQKRCLELKSDLDEQLTSLKRVSKTLDGEFDVQNIELNSEHKNWIFLKKNCFLDDIEKIFDKTKED